MTPTEARLMLHTPKGKVAAAERLMEIDRILKARLDKETYDLVVEATELSMDIVMAALE